MAAMGLPRDQGIDLVEAAQFRLGRASVHPSRLRIEAGGKTIPVDRRVMQMLVVLHTAGGATVTKQQLIAECWTGLAVSDDAITQCVSRLRRALATATEARVETVARIGYRLDAAPAGIPGDAAARRGLSRRTLVGSAAAAASFAALGALLLHRSPEPATDSIAVLPFANRSGDPGQTYLADGIAEEVRTALTRIAGLKVIGRTSCEALRGSEVTAAARRLGVGNVLTGSVRRSGDALRVTAELANGRSGVVRWARSYDLALGDALQVESEIAQSVAEALELQLGPPGLRAIAAGATRNAEALDLLIKAKQLMRASDTLAAVRQVLALCEAAIGFDPAYARAYALKGLALADFGGMLSADAPQMQHAFADAEQAARRAIAIAPQLAAGHAALARAFSGRLRVREAFAEYRRAERLAAEDPAVLDSFSRTLAESRMIGESLARAEGLISVDPLSARGYGAKGFALFFGRDYPAAIAALAQSLRLAPGITQYRNLVGDCLCLLGRHRAALEAYAATPEDDIFRLTGEALTAARTGERPAARRRLARLGEMFGDACSYQRAQILAQLGDNGAALGMLDRARIVLDPGLNALPADPFVDPLRHEPGFRRLLAALDFA